MSGSSPPGATVEERAALVAALRVGRVEALVVGVVLLAVVAGVAWWLLRPATASLEVDGEPIANAQQVLDTADPVFRALAEADGVEVPDGAGCWFAPEAEEGAASARGPRVACGPVALGIAGSGQRWVVGAVSYSPGTTGSGATGRFDRFTGVDDPSPSALRRPDGAEPPDVDLDPPTGGVRTEAGRRLVDADETLAAADRDFRAAARAEDASVGEDSRCHLATRETQGRRIALGSLFCGPVLLLGGDPGDAWLEVPAQPRDGDLLVDAVLGPVQVTSVRTPGPVPPGTTLYRPDGAAPGDPGDLAPPSAAPQEPGLVEIVDRARLSPEAAAQVDALRAPTDGRLRTPSLELDVAGTGRLDRLGEGSDALVAADGEEFVVAALDATVPDDAPDAAAVSLVVGGARLPLPPGQVPEAAVVVVSVPRGERDVDLEVLSAGRLHGISLVTGARPAGTPAAAYRQRPEAGQAAPVSATVPLPGAEPVTVTGAVTRSVVDDWTADQGYAPEGGALLVLTVDSWQVDRPATGVRVGEVTVAWRLLLPDGQERALPPAPATGFRDTELTFAVPVDLAGADLVADVTVAYEADGVTATATSSSAPAALAFPP